MSPGKSRFFKTFAAVSFPDAVHAATAFIKDTPIEVDMLSTVMNAEGMVAVTLGYTTAEKPRTAPTFQFFSGGSELGRIDAALAVAEEEVWGTVLCHSVHMKPDGSFELAFLVQP